MIYLRHSLYPACRRRPVAPSAMRVYIVYCKNIDHACARAPPENYRRRRRPGPFGVIALARCVGRYGGGGVGCTHIGFKNPRGKGSVTRHSGVEIRRHGRLLRVYGTARRRQALRVGKPNPPPPVLRARRAGRSLYAHRLKICKPPAYILKPRCSRAGQLTDRPTFRHRNYFTYY